MEHIDEQIDRAASEIATLADLLATFGQADCEKFEINAETLGDLGSMIEKRALNIREHISERST